MNSESGRIVHRSSNVLPNASTCVRFSEMHSQKFEGGVAIFVI